uniref:Uncharacterized protein n=1 Tax=Anguilla anguilla TaxID=7936 RepID=A0A0E9WV20_ANGAN
MMGMVLLLKRELLPLLKTHQPLLLSSQQLLSLRSNQSNTCSRLRELGGRYCKGAEPSHYTGRRGEDATLSTRGPIWTIRF